jgi:DNA/RNA-binding domain of Phe-tRNA-synthetase-like protein
MTKLTVAGAVRAAFPDLRIDAIVAHGFSGQEPWPEVAERLSRLEAEAEADAGHALPVDDDPHIASWRAAYRAFGTNPKFTPLGEPDATEHPHPGEVIYTDAQSVLTRHWNHRDAERTKVTEHSEDIVFVLETVDAPAFGADLDAATASLTALLRTRARAVEVRVLTAVHPACALPAR